MKTNLNLGVNVSSEEVEVNLSELNLSVEDWRALNKTERNDILQDYADEMNSQPCWCVDSFEEQE